MIPGLGRSPGEGKSYPLQYSGLENYTKLIVYTLFQQNKRRLYTWTSPDGQHRNQIDYILCSQRWRRSIRPFGINIKKRYHFIIEDCNAKVGSQEIPGVTGKFDLGVQNEANKSFAKRMHWS